ncbi:hypothetical protein F652_1692 [Enterobacteriaceae bacterium bta3-1]|nr:hypothetical protein F652_1692 [Enterobacteriaceae bacterium bta3-1]
MGISCSSKMRKRSISLNDGNCIKAVLADRLDAVSRMTGT